MSRHIIKLEHKGAVYYTEWSTVTDAPVQRGMSLEQFKQHYAVTYGRLALAKLDERLALVDKKGTSSLDQAETLDTLIRFNRAGVGQATITLDDLKDRYCKPWKKNEASDEF